MSWSLGMLKRHTRGSAVLSRELDPVDQNVGLAGLGSSLNKLLQRRGDTTSPTPATDSFQKLKMLQAFGINLQQNEPNCLHILRL